MTETHLDQAEKPQFYLTEDHHPENSTMLGFWLYLMSDCLIFAVLFATYGVLGRNYAAGPSPADLFDLSLVAINTAMLLLSSITYGFAMLQMQRDDKTATLFWLGITGISAHCFLQSKFMNSAILFAKGPGRAVRHSYPRFSRL
jgi:cytochrome o ubiquinol oxidase subunit 3